MTSGFFDIIFGVNKTKEEPKPRMRRADSRKEKQTTLFTRPIKMKKLMSSISETVGEPEDDQDVE